MKTYLKITIQIFVPIILISNVTAILYLMGNKSDRFIQLKPNLNLYFLLKGKLFPS